MKLLKNSRKKEVKVYVPRKEQVERMKQQTMIMNRAIIGV